MADGDDPGLSLDSISERLYDELRTLLTLAETVPAEVVDAAKGAFSWRTIDADLAQLAFDSLVDRDDLVLRSADVGTRRFISFEAAEVTIEIEVATVGGKRRVTGQLVPARPGGLDIRHAGQVLNVTVDEFGRFHGDIEPGPMSLRFQLAGGGGAVVETDWVTV